MSLARKRHLSNGRFLKIVSRVFSAFRIKKKLWATLTSYLIFTENENKKGICESHLLSFPIQFYSCASNVFFVFIVLIIMEVCCQQIASVGTLRSGLRF